MTATILVALLALTTALFASAVLAPSGRQAAQASPRTQALGGQALRATQFGI